MQLNTFEELLSLRTARLLAGLVLASFVGLTAVTVAAFGLIPIFTTQLQTLGGIQVYVDLVIMCLLFSVWMKFDAKANNRLFLPWFILTLAAGAIGPLLYLATRRTSSPQRELKGRS